MRTASGISIGRGLPLADEGFACSENGNIQDDQIYGAQFSSIVARQRRNRGAYDFPASRGLETTAKSAFTTNDATMLHSAMMT